MRCANSRASTSFGPPAANGLIMVRGRLGQFSALAPLVKANAMRATSALTTFPMMCSGLLCWLLQTDKIASAISNGSLSRKQPHRVHHRNMPNHATFGQLPQFAFDSFRGRLLSFSGRRRVLQAAGKNGSAY